jgi:hypothetical protein
LCFAEEYEDAEAAKCADDIDDADDITDGIESKEYSDESDKIKTLLREKSKTESAGGKISYFSYSFHII